MALSALFSMVHLGSEISNQISEEFWEALASWTALLKAFEADRKKADEPDTSEKNTALRSKTEKLDDLLARNCSGDVRS